MTAYANGARIAELADQARRAVSVEAMADRAGVKLRRAGSELRGSCPLCGAGQGSKSVFAVKGDKWRCYGCSLRGDVIDLVMELDGGRRADASQADVGPQIGADGARAGPG
jgi:DNA primase